VGGATSFYRIFRRLHRIFSRTLAAFLNTMPDRPWAELRKGKTINERWIAHLFRPYRIFPKTIRIENEHARDYLEEDFIDAFRRYIPKSEVEALKAELKNSPPPPSTETLKHRNTSSPNVPVKTAWAEAPLVIALGSTGCLALAQPHGGVTCLVSMPSHPADRSASLAKCVFLWNAFLTRASH
jgi:hypothetical protein